ncbi:rab GTPase-activating protein 1-like isoform X2 [Ischnura elegans]|nr:rab GTPase-activating protein 1-like isoform X2 [Ischnura elegans]
MEDSLSVKSNDSGTTSEEYEMVGGVDKESRGATEPTLRIADDGDIQTLEKSLKEVLAEKESGKGGGKDEGCQAVNKVSKEESKEGKEQPQEMKAPKKEQAPLPGEQIAVQKPSLEVPDKGDTVSADEEDEEDLLELSAGEEEDCTTFCGVRYLGGATIKAPKSETEIQRNMAILASQASSELPLRVSLSVPNNSAGTVVLYDAATETVIARYEVQRILFYARGSGGCFAFTLSHGSSQESAIFQCHVFRCDIPEAVDQVSACFAKAFRRVPSEPEPQEPTIVGGTESAKATPRPAPESRLCVFEVSLEIKEEDGKGSFITVPKDKTGFKLRAQVEKQIVVVVKQQFSSSEQNSHAGGTKPNASQQPADGKTPHPWLRRYPRLTRTLPVERCFGLLVSPGKNVRHGDMHLLEMMSMSVEEDGQQSYVISGQLDPSEKVFEALNVETSTVNQHQQFGHHAHVSNSTNATNSAQPAANSNQSHPAPIDNNFITVGVDLVLRGIREPVRFLIEAPVRVFPSTERFWYSTRRPLLQHFYLHLEETVSSVLSPASDQPPPPPPAGASSLSPSSDDGVSVHYEVLGMDTCGEVLAEKERNRLNLSLNLAGLINRPFSTYASLTASMTGHAPSLLSPKEEEPLSDGDEPLLSGTGEVSRDCTQVELQSWADALQRWRPSPSPNLSNSATSPLGGPPSIISSSSDLPAGAASRPRQLAALVRQGVPEALRGEVWQRLANCENDARTMDTYRILITKESGCEAVIQRDIHRTFPAHNFFKESGGLGQDSLYRISKAYAVYDEEVGYCQGLSFLAAALLLHMPEEQAFCVLVKLMFDYGLRDLFKDGFENLYMRLYQLNRLMEEQLPDLWQHFCERGVESHMFGSQWFLTLFTAKFPLCFVYHILDVFLLQGMDTLFQVALALLTTSQKDLLQLDFEGILKYFRVTLPKKCRNEETAKKLVKLACSIKVKKLKKYEAEFNALKDSQEGVVPVSEVVEEEVQQSSESLELDRTRLALQRSEEDRKRLEEEVTQVKDMLKREIAKSDEEICRNNIIIAEYKQICSQLSLRLEKEQAAAKEAIESIRVAIGGCERCSRLPWPDDGDYSSLSSSNLPGPTSSSNLGELPRAQQRIRELELQLARTKLAQVEAECRNQELTHRLSAPNQVQGDGCRGGSGPPGGVGAWPPPWLSRTLSTLKEAAATANRRDPSGQPLPQSQQQNANAVRRESAPGWVAPTVPQQPRDPPSPPLPHVTNEHPAAPPAAAAMPCEGGAI